MSRSAHNERGSGRACKTALLTCHLPGLRESLFQGFIGSVSAAAIHQLKVSGCWHLSLNPESFRSSSAHLHDGAADLPSIRAGRVHSPLPVLQRPLAIWGCAWLTCTARPPETSPCCCSDQSRAHKLLDCYTSPQCMSARQLSDKSCIANLEVGHSDRVSGIRIALTDHCRFCGCHTGVQGRRRRWWSHTSFCSLCGVVWQDEGRGPPGTLCCFHGGPSHTARLALRSLLEARPPPVLCCP